MGYLNFIMQKKKKINKVIYKESEYFIESGQVK